ncbi:MAG: S8 family peptidase [Acidimicrobiia bacterium]|nr:S8 family peptidase [Acidimicrobiia bacterium]
MSDTPPDGAVPRAPAPDRRVLTGGERLRIHVEDAPSGGGEKYEPQTPEQARELLLPMVRDVTQQAFSLRPELRGSRLYVEARLLPNYLAASHFPETLLRAVDAVPVGSHADKGVYQTKRKQRESVTRRVILAMSDRGLERLGHLIESPGRARSEQQAFSDIRKLDHVGIATPESVVLRDPESDQETTTWEAVLHPIPSSAWEPTPLDEVTLDKWFTLVEETGGDCHRDFVRRVGGLTFSPVTIPTGAADRLAEFNPLRAMRPMPAIRPLPGFATRSHVWVGPPATRQPAAEEPRVAVFDGGVHSPGANSLFGAVPTSDLTPEPATTKDMDHGTAVVGAAMFGLANTQTALRQPPCPVESFRVVPPEKIPGDLAGYWVLDRIVEAVRENDLGIVNLSIGPELATEDSHEPDRWTSELDHLAWEHNVLFVVAAGNGGTQPQVLGLHHVQVPGDMVNGITVGACNAPPPSRPWSRADYSSMGPGRHGNRVQPTGVQFGGTNEIPFEALGVDGSLVPTAGTSFAAPLVTHALADLATRLPVATPSVLRTFAVHYADRHPHWRKRMNEVGYGRFPLEFAPLLESGAHEVHVLFVDEIDRRSPMGYRLPLPDDIPSALEFRMTLAYLSPVEPTEPTEYTSASIDMVFRPHHQVFRFRPPEGTSPARSQTYDLRTEQARELLQEGWQISTLPATKALTRASDPTEPSLRDSGKWETVRHYRFRMAAGAVERPSLEFRYLARNGGRLSSYAETIPFAVLVSLVDKSPDSRLHDRVRAQFRQLTPVSRTRIRLRGHRATT